MTGPTRPSLRVLLTGATGRVGRMLMAEARRDMASSVHLVAQHRQPRRDDGLFWPDLADPRPFLDRVAHDGPPDAMIVLSGVTPATGADLSLNVSLPLWAYRAARAAGVRRVLVASSSAVYGAGRGEPMDEESPLDPVNDYGRAKAAMEKALLAETGPELCLMRIGNVAGADALLLNLAAAGDQPVVIDRFADGSGPLRSYIGPGALWRALCALLRHCAPLPPHLNLAAPAPVRMEALAAAARHPFIWREAPPTAHQVITLDCRRLLSISPLDPAASSAETMVAEWKACQSK